MVGIDLGEDKQALALVDHDVRVLWRKTVRVQAHRLGEALDEAVAAARAAGSGGGDGGVRADGAAVDAGAAAVRRAGPGAGVRAAAGESHIAREQEDYTAHKRDESDAVLIARLAAELHCYVPEQLDEAWAHLRGLGRRREER